MFSKTKISGVALATLVAVAFIACGGGSDGASLDKQVKDLKKACYKNDYAVNDINACKKVVEIYKKECDKGSGEACFRLGDSYLDEGVDGWSITQAAGDDYDKVQAISFLNKSCDLNYGKGCQFLSWQYEDDFDKRQKFYEKAIQLFEKECENGIIASCANAGSAHIEGWEVQGRDEGKTKVQNYHKGLQLLQKYCDKAEKGDKNIHSCLTLGGMFAEGKGTTQDYEQAKKYFKKVCDFGEQSGCDAYKKANEKSK